MSFVRPSRRQVRLLATTLLVLIVAAVLAQAGHTPSFRRRGEPVAVSPESDDVAGKDANQLHAMTKEEADRRDEIRKMDFASLHANFAPATEENGADHAGAAVTPTSSDFAASDGEKILLLFDLDDTLAPMGEQVTSRMTELLKQLHDDGRYALSLLSTTALSNAMRQLGPAAQWIDYILVENGLVSLRRQGEGDQAKWVPIEENSIRNLDPDALKKLDSAALEYIKDLLGVPTEAGDHPAGDARDRLVGMYESFGPALFNPADPSSTQQITYKTAMLNYSPIGANIPTPREGYSKLRSAWKGRPDGHEILGLLMDYLEEKSEGVNYAMPGTGKVIPMAFNIGGSTGVDAFPRGWTKEYGLNLFLNRARGGGLLATEMPETEIENPFHPFKTFIFFGDKTLHPSGNDYHVCRLAERLCEVRWEGLECCQAVEGPQDTEKIIVTGLLGGQ